MISLRARGWELLRNSSTTSTTATNLQKRRFDRFEANGAFKFPRPYLADRGRKDATMVEAFGLNQGHAKVYTPTRDERLRCDSGGVVARLLWSRPSASIRP